MIAVGYATLCRRCELVNIALDDLVRLPGGGKALVRRAKNDPFGDGRWAFLSARGHALQPGKCIFTGSISPRRIVRP